MAWAGMIRTWDTRASAYRKLIVRIEDCTEPGCLVRIYEGDEVVDEEFADSPRIALHKAIEMARRHLKDPAITEETLDWVQV